MSKGFFVLDERNAALREILAEDPELEPAFMRRYMMSWLYHDNALDGLVLTEQEITLALEHHVVADPSSMQVIHAIRAHKRAYDRIEAEARAKGGKISIPLLRSLYETFIEGTHATEKELAIYRMEIPLHRVYQHEFAQPEDIEPGLRSWIRKLGSAEFKEKHPIRQAANAHWHFMQIFPFAEHNGRIGRLIQAFYLLRAGHLPPVIHGRERMPYYQSLQRSAGVLRALVADSMELSLENSLRYLRSTSQKQAG